MSGNTLETKIRVSAIVDEAIKALRQVKAATADLNTASKGAGSPGLDGLAQGAKEATTQTRKTRDEVEALKKAEKDAADQRRKLQAEDKVAAKKVADDAKAKQKSDKALADDAVKTARQQTNQARMLGPQVTDIVTGLATGQSPFQVLLQQGGQLRDIFGGVGNAAKALLSIFTPLRVIIGATAAVAATFAFEVFKGSQESLALAKSLAVTGNVAGTTAGQLNQLAKDISTSQKASIADVRETLAILIDTGSFTGSTLGTAGRAVTAFTKLTGKSKEDAIASFAEMGDGVAIWATKQNKAYNFITAAQFKYIQQLEAQGRTQEAMRFTLDTLSSTMEQRTGPALGTLEKLWANIGRAVSSVSDKLKAIGRDETPEDRVKRLTERLADLQALQERSLAQGQTKPKSKFLENAQADLDNERDLANRKALRESENSIALQAEQEKIKQASKGFQDQLAQIDLAGAQKLLQQRLAVLDSEQSAADRAFDRGLTSALAHNAALNRVDRERLEAQAGTIKRQIEIESARVEEKPEDKIAKKARVTELEGQLVEVQSRIRQSISQGRGLVEADALNTARERAQQWARVWQQAADQVRQFTAQNAATQAAQISDPSARAAADASAKLIELRKQVEDLKRDLALQIIIAVDPSQKAELVRQLEEINIQAQRAIDEQSRNARFASLQQQQAELQQALQIQEQRIDQQVEAGTITTVEGERQKFEARAKAVPQLEQILQLLQSLAASPAEKNAVEQTVNEINKVKLAKAELETTARSAGKSGLVQFFDDISTGAKSGKAALLDMVGSFAKAMLRLLEERLAEKLVAQFASAAGSSGGGGGGGGNFLAAAVQFFASMFHTGGVVGQSSGSGSRMVSAALFAAAPRYHSGGIVGLRPGERPIIAEDGELVLTKQDQRNLARGNNVSISVTVNGAGGDAAAQEASGQALAQELAGVVDQRLQAWSARESRVGGLLAAKGTR